jgi:hypothetical protein
MGSNRREHGPDRASAFRPGDHYTLTFRGSLFFCRNSWKGRLVPGFSLP